ncbi:MAG: Co2+/Mg2+ efflux protein ApaG [Bacteroidia bacterium]
MATLITQGIRISVESAFQPQHSKPQEHEYFFAYRIRIENTSDYTVQLLRRHWYIFDSIGVKHEVEGDGVVGKQPVLSPGEKYQYESACTLMSEMGAMHGLYTMERNVDGVQFDVQIPRFELMAAHRLN